MMILYVRSRYKQFFDKLMWIIFVSEWSRTASQGWHSTGLPIVDQ